MSKADEFLKVVKETSYPPDVFFTGGNMPEDQEEDGDGKKECRNLAHRFSCLAEDFLGEGYGLDEKKWSGDVDTKKTPPEGTFTNGVEAIADWFKSSHKDMKSAVAALNFYRNRNPENMSQDKHDKILGVLHTAYGD